MVWVWQINDIVVANWRSIMQPKFWLWQNFIASFLQIFCIYLNKERTIDKIQIDSRSGLVILIYPTLSATIGGRDGCQQGKSDDASILGSAINLGSGMGSWLALLLTISRPMSTGRCAQYRWFYYNVIVIDCQSYCN